MPKELTHWLLAERALAALPEESALRRIIALHRAAYLGGAVLPDTLAHLVRGPFHSKAGSLSERFHNPSGNSYAPLIRAERQFAGPLPAPLFACFLGVVSHMEADAALHPYVYAAAGNRGIGEHYRIETGIDLHFLGRGERPPQRRLDRLLSASGKEALVSAATRLFDPEGELPRRAVEHSLALHCRFQGMYDRLFWKLAVRALGRVWGSPFSEQRHLFYPLRGRAAGEASMAAGQWRHPESGEVSGASVGELARRAVERTVVLMRRIEEQGSLALALADHPGANLLTGLHGVAKRG